MQIAVHHLLGLVESQHLGEEFDAAVQIVAVEQAVVEALHLHALEVVGPGLWIDPAHLGAVHILLRVEFEQVAGG